MGTIVVDRYQYGHDRNGNRLWRDDLVNASFGEIYTYDDLNQIIGFERGTLNGNKDGLTGSPSRSQNWEYDAVGNFDSVTTDGTPQTRGHNRLNEITSVSGATTPEYDANGNLIKDQAGQQYVYDAWNRLVEVKDASDATIVEYAYDALGRRTTETRGSDVRHLYYSASWQVLEEFVDDQVEVRQVWSPVYIDALLMRQRDTDGNGTLDERLWAVHDANFNVVALVNDSGVVVEKYAYDVYGAVVVMDASYNVLSGSAYAWVYLHQGGRLDIDTGLYHFRHREYHPGLGRWLQRDPIEFDARDVNLYRALGNDPVNDVDPSGLEVAGYHHFYSLFLGGSDDQPLFPLTKQEHTAAHDVLRKHGVGRTHGISYDQARARWAAKTTSQQRAIILEAMKAANIPEPVAQKYINSVFQGASPGTNNSPLRKTPRKSQCVSKQSLDQFRKAQALATKYGTTVTLFGVTFFYDQSVQAGEKSGTKLAELIGLGTQLKIDGDLGLLPSTRFEMDFRGQSVTVECLPDPADSKGGHFITAFYTEHINQDGTWGSIKRVLTLGNRGVDITIQHWIIKRSDGYKTYGFVYPQK